MKTIKPLSGRGKDISYEFIGDNIQIQWGEMEFSLERKLLNDVLVEFFIDKDKWYALGASMTEPILGGLGEYLSIKKGLSPRHASVLASIMNEEKLVTYKIKRRIDLKRIV